MKTPAEYEMHRVCSRAIAAYGEEKQFNHVVEELNELGVAVNHFRRGRIASEDVLEEMADVIIMIEQLRIMIIRDDIDLQKMIWKKLEKLEGKIVRENEG
jgi:NTP pyrophosphatase (non-canonical NTP hydrolase)